MSSPENYCITSDNKNEFSFTFGENYNCYPKCDNHYYFDKNKNYICLNKKEYSDDYIFLIEEKKCLYIAKNNLIFFLKIEMF